MIGTLVGSGIAACFIYGSMKWKHTDLQKMQHVFRNINYRVGGRVPRLIKRTKYENKTEYVFAVPYGLSDDNKLQPTLQKTLAKPVEVKFKGKLIINVYESDLPTKYDYDWSKTDKWTVPVGRDLNGQILHDFNSIPHMTVAGMTRQGKTVFLKLVLAHLINNNPSVEFYIVDLKGGLEFGKYERLQQVKSVSGNVDEADRILQSILNRLNDDLQRFKSNGWNNITHTKKQRRTFILVDEAAELDDRCQKKLSKVARIGGALGYRLMFATQYPTADTLPRQIKQNREAKISYRLPTKVDRRVAIDENGAEGLNCPGRAIYRTHERKEIQAPFISDDEILERLKMYVKDKTEDKQTGENIIKFG